MSDNTVLPGTGETYAADDVDGAKHQRVKISVGADGSATDATADDAFPVKTDLLDAVNELVKQQKKTNLLLVEMLGEDPE